MDIRAWERLKIPSIVLMENAGSGAAQVARSLVRAPRSSVLCVAGAGNNGGDALVVARHLALAGHRVEVALVESAPDRSRPADAEVQVRIVRAMALPLTLLDPASPEESLASVRQLAGRAELIVDGLLGTGLSSAPRGLTRGCIDAIVAARRPTLALDLPSGLDCDSGEPLGACVEAVATATFVAPKLGFANPASRRFVGAIHVIGIGAPLLWPPEGHGRVGAPSAS